MKKRIRGMIFDFGGVLGLPQKDEARNGMMVAVGIDEASFFQSYFDMRIEYDRGTISRREYWTEVLARVGIVISEEIFETLIVVDEESWVSENCQMIDFIGRNRDRMEKLGILSNMPRDFVPSIIRQFDWISWFDYSLWSCDVHMVKPEQEIYLRTAEELGLSVADCLFIDDSMINVEGARAVGMEAIHYVNFESFLEEFKANYRLE
ncbi:HAD family phosphatase [Gottschalkiaceae bacterium SANA]|nr:HAD family phosphatase [Gottschalkiaceae bacterium SANA]